MDKHESVDLDALDQLHAAATKGEWRVSITSNEDSCLGRYVFQVVEYPYKGNHEIFAANPYNRSEEELIADVELTAALHNAYPAMAEELRALREERNTLRAEAESIKAKWHSEGCAHCDERPGGHEGTIWCAECFNWHCSEAAKDRMQSELDAALAEAARLREALERICKYSRDADCGDHCSNSCMYCLGHFALSSTPTTAEWLAARDAAQRRIGAAAAREDSARLDAMQRKNWTVHYCSMHSRWEVLTDHAHPADRKTYTGKTARAAIDAARKRDPRVDPRPGDELEFVTPEWNKERMRVVGTGEDMVRYQQKQLAVANGKWSGSSCDLARWRDWMAGSRVIHAAD